MEFLMKNVLPLISCLLVSKRKEFLLNSYKNYISQTYNNKELIVVYSGNDSDIPIELKQDKSVTISMYPLEKTLGEARNESIRLANGEYVVQWDDDDINHPDRLSFQIKWMLDRVSVISIFNQQYHKMNNKVFLEKRKIKEQSIHSGWPGTVMARKNIVKDIYPKERIEEDTNGLKKIDEMIDVISLENQKWYYMYVYHGNNTWGLTHNMYMIEENAMKENEVLDDLSELYDHIDTFGISDYEIWTV